MQAPLYITHTCMHAGTATTTSHHPMQGTLLLNNIHKAPRSVLPLLKQTVDAVSRSSMDDEGCGTWGGVGGGHGERPRSYLDSRVRAQRAPLPPHHTHTHTHNTQPTLPPTLPLRTASAVVAHPHRSSRASS